MFLETLYEKKMNPAICMAKLFGGNLAIVGNEWGGIGYINLGQNESFLSLFTPTDKIRVQALDCAYIFSVMVIAWGGSRGNVSVIHLKIIHSV